MLKTVHIKTASLEDNGASASWLSNNKANIKTTVDGEALAKEIEKQGNLLIKDGYQILSILPITSQKIESHSLSATFTSGVIITAAKIN
ncbi:hypothetical protein [Aliarcobacter butzleri]|uniref:Uncharacterized protein n=1 Tax=Aliarcobacter butzleri L352 TaxID=1447260 RepID=A0A837JEL6_9BACT|nr:hypothetical protein [Aliarcobacter butzleri]KLE06320.1 hypothetical protein AF77_02315 [Aliarcobacter butzleri L352]